jgi:branched-chain amino acid transport system permease protein
MFVGGAASLFGSVLGALFYVYVPLVTGTVSPERSSIIYGACLLAVLFLAPRGLAGATRSLVHRILPALRRFPSRRSPAAAPGSPTPAPDDLVAEPTGRTSR